MTVDTQSKTYEPSAAMVARAHIGEAKYNEMYAASIADPDTFWGEQGKRIDWIKPYTSVKDVDFTLGNVHINWYADATLNVSANCIDRHLATRGDQTAIIFEPDSHDEPAHHLHRIARSRLPHG
jgi:acetyl-CoA synthetase